ncbi:sodium-dependent nutrient amino acid transporter 1-like [Toxorhynchites rutilus septentrionalis]|uniref:sodium-dependent nutrient amino acid transporter 1-like n=1 Tax=Toxorhynchites rutilus septentrionalis TaxID=329112 RepID=UPI002478B720|nr:sodium-dependent nutrient amino acid transporter 1-like [Toxorhynchites rutilus septentrionalis]
MENNLNNSYCGKDNKNVSNGLSHANGIALAIPISETPSREKWGKGVEFMLSCIAYSVGFGNIWKFPYTALENGGGAFLIPYLVVLFVIGRPIYYLEMVMGQFCSRGCVKIYDMAPLMRGVGVGQSIAMFVVMTYYTPVLAITLYYLIASFSTELPWSTCDPSWSHCINSNYRGYLNTSDPELQNMNVSAELYFTKTVMHRAPLADGIGFPDSDLTICLLISWLVVAGILIKGIRSTGKAAYFLALFPYVIILVLFIHSCTLEGAWKGIMFFLTPKWDQLFTARVWMEAVTQCFFSLSICFGGIIAYSSFNNFSNNVYRDAMIISWLDTFTSIIVGCIVFGVLGNLAHVTHKENIQDVVRQGPGLTFMAYPDAIAKFEYLPQLFSILFFLMLFIVGIGSNLGVITSIITAIRDRCPEIPNWKVASTISVLGFSLSTVYMAPGGLDLLDVFDNYGAKYVTLTFALFELITFAWIYGVDRICRDIYFMLNIKTSKFWRICWAIVAPVVVGVILAGSFIEHKPVDVPWEYNVMGWFVYAFAVIQLPIWAIYSVHVQEQKGFLEKLKSAFNPTKDWGPEDENTREVYMLSNEKHKSITGASEKSSVGAFVYRRIFS